MDGVNATGRFIISATDGVNATGRFIISATDGVMLISSKFFLRKT